VEATRNLIDAMESAGMRPAAFVSASGAGYHGDRGDDIVRTTDPPGADFLGRMAAAWETASRGAETLGARVVHLRLGLVLGRGGGALPKMSLPFRFGLGAALGSGRQWWPWIHRDDAAALFFRAATDASLTGPVHGVAGSATNLGFSGTLAGALRRPLFLRIPGWVLRFALGEMGNLFLHGQRIEPDSRFGFRHADLSTALRQP
jgi:uncharacterized protein